MIFKNTAILVIILVISGTLLGLANEMTKKKIDDRKIEEYGEKLGGLFPEIDEISDRGEYSEIYLKGKLIGYTSEGESKGYQSNIRVLVGFDEKKDILGVKMVEQGETPGVGTKTAEESFLNRFIRKEPDAVDGVTGATVSSNAVKSAVKSARGALP